jgi:hypothetical protein
MKHLRWMLVAAIAFLSGQALTLRAAITCTTEDYKGVYAFYTGGAFAQLPPQAALVQGPFSQAGTFTSDGQGNVVVESTPSFNGLILPSTSTTTYTITPECVITYSLTLPEPLPVPSTFTGILSLGGRQNTVMVTDPPGTVVVGEHVKQDLRFCGVGDFNGAYQIDIGGSITQPRERAGLFHRLGRLVSDGAGNFTATSFASYNGRIAQESFSGTYDVNSRCFVTLKYVGVGQENITITGALGGHGEIAMVMVASQGWAVSGFLRAQQQ